MELIISLGLCLSNFVKPKPLFLAIIAEAETPQTLEYLKSVVNFAGPAIPI